MKPPTVGRIFRIYCESQGVRYGDEAAKKEHLRTPPMFRNGHPQNPIWDRNDDLIEVGAADFFGGRRLRGRVVAEEDERDWDVLCGKCGSYIRRVEVTE